MRHLLILAGIVGLSGCYRTVKLPPPPEPAKNMPNVASEGEPGEGLARVILDAEPGSALVEKISGGSVGATVGTQAMSGALEMRSRLCTTPCVVDLGPGPYELQFTSLTDATRTSRAFINVDQRPSIYRHTLGKRDNKAWKGFVGWPVAVLGGIFALGGAATISDSTGGGLTGLVLGGGMVGLGTWLIMGAKVTEQPGSGVQWYPAPTQPPQ